MELNEDLSSDGSIRQTEQDLFGEEEFGMQDGHQRDDAENDFLDENEHFNVKPEEENEIISKPVKKKKPRLTLNFELIRGPRGLTALNNMFKNFKFKGKHNELEDLSELMKKLEQWCNHIYPRYHFEDSLKKLEIMGKKRLVQIYLRKIRLGLIDDDDVVRQYEEDNENNLPDDVGMADPFDVLLADQISQTQQQSIDFENDVLSNEQKNRLVRNRMLAEERKLARLKAQQELKKNYEGQIDISQSSSIDFISLSQVRNVTSEDPFCAMTELRKDLEESENRLRSTKTGLNEETTIEESCNTETMILEYSDPNKEICGSNLNVTFSASGESTTAEESRMTALKNKLEEVCVNSPNTDEYVSPSRLHMDKDESDSFRE